MHFVENCGAMQIGVERGYVSPFDVVEPMESKMSKPKRIEMAVPTECTPSQEKVIDDEVDLSMQFLDEDRFMNYLVEYPKLEIPMRKKIGNRIVSIH